MIAQQFQHLLVQGLCRLCTEHSFWAFEGTVGPVFLSFSFLKTCNRNSLSETGSYWLNYCRNGSILALLHCLCHLHCQEALNSRGMLWWEENFGCLLYSFPASFLHTRTEDCVGLICPLKMPERKLIYYIMLMFCTVLFEWLHVRAGLLYWYGNSWINFFLVKSVIFMVFTWNYFLFLIAEHMLVSRSSYSWFCWDQIYQWDLEDVTMLKNRLYMLGCLSASFLQLKVQ